MKGGSVFGALAMIVLLVGLIILFIGILYIHITAERCEEIKIIDLVNVTCERLLESYECCVENAPTVFVTGNCNTRYLPLILEEC